MRPSGTEGRPNLPQVRSLREMLGLVGVTALFFAPVWAGRLLLYGGLDIQTIHYPLHAAYAAALRQEQLLLWTPLLANGFPLFAEGQMGGLYPPNLLLYRLLPLDLAHNANPLLHLLLAQVAAYTFARQLRLSRVAAALAGFAYGWSVPASALGDFTPAYTLAWMPAVLAALEWGYRTRHSIAFLLAGGVLGLQGLIFFPQGVALTGLAAGCYALVRLGGMARHSPGPAARSALATLGAAILGAALSAAQWLPTLELTRFSVRAAGLDPAFAGQGSLPPWAIGTFWAPHLLDMLGSAGYVGILPLFLAALALPQWRRDGRVGFAALLAGLALILALGRYSPLFPLTSHLPGFSFFRNAVRFTYLTRFGLILLAGLGWDRLCAEGGWKSSALRRWGLGIAAAGVALTGGALTGGWLLARLAPALTALGYRYAAERLAGTGFHVQSADYFQARVAQVLGAFQTSLSPGNRELWAALTLALAVAGWILWRRRGPSPIWMAAGGALVVADLLGHAGGLGFVPAEAAHQVPGVVTFLQTTFPVEGQHATSQCGLEQAPPPCQGSIQGRIYTLVDQPVVPGEEAPYPLPENVNLRYGIPSVGVYSSLGYLRSYELLKDLGAVNLAFGVAPTDEATLYARLPLLSLLGARHILAVHPLGEDADLPLPASLELAYQDGGTWVYENRAVLPRAFVLPRAELGLPPGEVLRRMLAPEFDPTETVLLEERPSETAEGFVGPEAHLLVEEAARVVVETNGGGWLLLTDAFYPGWRAWVDGSPAAIYRADYMLRAVPLGPGPHRVEFRYEPRWFQAGLWVSSVGWVATLLVAGVLAWRSGSALAAGRA
ncbi:MAG: YfhO family protein [Anaerolineae bacterium]